MQSLQARPVTRCGTVRWTSVVRCAARPTIAARFGGGDVLDRPDMSIKRSGWDSDKDSNVATLPPRTETGGNDGSTNKQRGSVPGGGSWRVLLVDSPTHKERPVVQAITTVVSNADEAHARNCFATSKQLGVAIVVSCLKEIAEHYVQQLYMKGLKVTMEPDTAAI